MTQFYQEDTNSFLIENGLFLDQRQNERLQRGTSNPSRLVKKFSHAENQFYVLEETGFCNKYKLQKDGTTKK